MKPRILITRPVGHRATDLLRVLCDVQIVSNAGIGTWSRAALAVLARDATALLVAPDDFVDDALIDRCRRLQIVATTAHFPHLIDIAACTRRGVWVTAPPSLVARRARHDAPDAAELDAARNIIDVLNRDTPRSAINSVRRAAAPYAHIYRHNGERAVECIAAADTATKTMVAR